VRDRGPGVPERRLARVFEPFYRGEDELTRETQGSGIGLALVRGLAERMGAGVSARNAPGGGFEVTLRFAAA
jgi:signal transduction histidine kinase